MRRLLLAVPPAARQCLLQHAKTADLAVSSAEALALVHRLRGASAAGGRFSSATAVSEAEPEHAAPAPDAEAGLKPSPAPPPSPTPAAAQGAGESTAAAFATPASDGAAAPAGAGATAAATAAAAEPPDELTSQERSEWNQKAFTVQQEMSDLMKAGRQGEAVTLFQRHVAECVAKAAETRALPDSLLLLALRPKYVSFKLYFMAVKQAGVPQPMDRAAEYLCHMRTFGHVPDQGVYEPALAAALPLNKRDPVRAPDALAAGRLVGEMLDKGVKPNAQCFFLSIMACAEAKELTMASWLVRQLGSDMADLEGCHPGGLRACLTGALLANARAGRLDDAADVLDVASRLHIRISAGALQAILPFVTERLRTDILRQAVDTISRQVTTEGRQTMPIKMDEGTLLAVLNAAATQADGQLARDTWALLVRSLAQPALRPLSASLPPPDSQSGGVPAAAEQSLPAGPDAKPPPAAAGGEFGQPGGAGGSEAAARLQQRQQPAGGDAGTVQAEGRHRDYEPSRSSPLHAPSISSFHAMIHALAASGDLRGAFDFVRELQRQHPAAVGAAAWYRIPFLVDAIAPSVEQIDAAYFVLEDMHSKGEVVAISMLNAVVAACAQVGDLARAFETFEAAPALGLTPDVDTYNALMWGCMRHGQNASTTKLLEELQAAGLAPNAKTHELLVDSAVVANNVPGMLAALQDMSAAKSLPSIALLERCVMRAERAGDVPTLQLLMGRLDLLNYKMVGIAAKLRRWEEEGGMPVLVGGGSFVSRPMSGGYRHPDIFKSTTHGAAETRQRQLDQEADQQQGLEPDIAFEDWNSLGARAEAGGGQH